MSKLDYLRILEGRLGDQALNKEEKDNLQYYKYKKKEVLQLIK